MNKYECRQANLRDAPSKVLEAGDSYAARTMYAAELGLTVLDVIASRVFEMDSHLLETIAKAAATGGHVMVGRTGECSIVYRGEHGGRCTLSHIYVGADEIAAEARARGVLTVDCRTADLSRLIDVAVKGPILAESWETPDAPPYHSFSKAPRAEWIRNYRWAGATVSEPA